MALNRMTLQGRLTKAPELRYTQAGKPVASFTVAWSEKYKETERKLFLPCVAWRGTAEFVSRHFDKGSEIVVEGTLGSRRWQDKEGNNRETIELTVDNVHFCGPKREAQGGYTDPEDFEEIDDEDDSDLPF